MKDDTSDNPWSPYSHTCALYTHNQERTQAYTHTCTYKKGRWIPLLNLQIILKTKAMFRYT